MEKAIASTADEIKPNILSRDDRIASSNDFNESNREKVSTLFNLPFIKAKIENSSLHEL